MMTKYQLTFDLLHGLQCDADNDQERRSTDRQVGDTEEPLHQYRDRSEDRQADRTDEGDVLGDSLEVIRGRTARTDTRNEATALLHVIRYFYRIELDLCVEEGKRDDQQGVQRSAERM